MRERILQDVIRADVLSAPLSTFQIHAPIFAILSRLSTMSFTTPMDNFLQKSSDKHSTDSRVYLLSGLSPLMSMSSELANSSMDWRMNASHELFVERVATFLNDDPCAWASIFGECRKPTVHLRHGFTSGDLPWESDEARVIAFCCTLPRCVKLSPRNTNR